MPEAPHNTPSPDAPVAPAPMVPPRAAPTVPAAPSFPPPPCSGFFAPTRRRSGEAEAPPASTFSIPTPNSAMVSRPAGDFMEGILAAAREESAQFDSVPLTLSADGTLSPPAVEEIPCPIAPKELPAGTLLHGYRVQRTIGSGGFGVTYLAQESLLNRRVVVKESFPDSLCYREEGTLDVCMHDPDTGQEAYDWALSNFLREVRLLATLDHPCIAKIYSYFEEHRTAYYVVEFINGISLDKLAAQHAAMGTPIPQSSLFGLMVRLLDALDYLHSRQLLHRDIKPDNILITRAGLPVIIDFGAAREAYGDLGNSIVETPGFSPTEQSTPNGHMGPWTDIYALGATLYYTLTGTCLPTCRQRDIYDTAEPLASNTALLATYSPALLATIDRATAPSPAQRYQSIAEWMHDLAAIRL